MFSEQQFDDVLGILENPVRRQILRRLSQEPSYPLQLAKELGLSQQLVDKHLKALEKIGLVTSTFQQSPAGPKRRAYTLRRSLSLTLDLAPNLFARRFFAFDAPQPKRKMSQEASVLMQKLEKIKNSGGEKRMGALESLLREIDESLGNLDSERATLLYLRNMTMSEAADIISDPEKPTDFRRVLFELMDLHSKDVAAISRALNLREGLVREILEELERDFLLPDF